MASPEIDRAIIEKLELEKSTLEWGLRFLDRMTVKPAEEGSIEECRNIYNLAILLKDHYIKAHKEIEARQASLDFKTYQPYSDNKLKIDFSAIDKKKAVELTEANVKNAKTN